MLQFCHIVLLGESFTSQFNAEKVKVTTHFGFAEHWTLALLSLSISCVALSSCLGLLQESIFFQETQFSFRLKNHGGQVYH